MTMTSQTITLTSNESELSCNISPAIHLDPSKKHGLGLISFNTYNLIRNVLNKKFYYGSGEYIEIPDGAYSIEDLQDLLQEKIPSLELVSITSSKKVKIKSPQPIDFQREDTIQDLLGFKPRMLEPNVWHVSDNRIALLQVETIQVHCNLVGGSYINGTNAHILHEFRSKVSPSYGINEHPAHIIYLPLNTNYIHNIHLRVTDHNNKLIDFSKEQIEIRLELKTWD